jgi:hypothetical protein
MNATGGSLNGRPTVAQFLLSLMPGGASKMGRDIHETMHQNKTNIRAVRYSNAGR